MSNLNSSEEPNEAYFRMREEMQMSVAQSNAAVNNRLYLVLMMVTGLAAIVALIISLVVFSSQGATTCVIGGSNGDLSGAGGTRMVDAKIWNIAIGHMATNEAYIDPVTGTVKGFHVDIVYEVCKIANKNCHLIWDLYNRCWDSEVGEVPRGGQGLMAGWYDGCVGWMQSYDRARTFKFSKPFAKAIKSFFIVKSNNPRGVNPSDLTGKVIGFIDSYVSDELCLNRQEGITGSKLPESQIRHFSSPQDLYNAIIAGEVDAGFASESTTSVAPDSIKVLTENSYTCTKPDGGSSMMTRQDNGLVDWWNPAQDSLLRSATYKQICKDITEAHGGVPGKDISMICLGM